MTCCFSVGHFHIHLPLANYVCYTSYLAVPSIIVENKNCFNISLCSHPNYKSLAIFYLQGFVVFNYNVKNIGIHPSI